MAQGPSTVRVAGTVVDVEDVQLALRTMNVLTPTRA